MVLAMLAIFAPSFAAHHFVALMHMLHRPMFPIASSHRRCNAEHLPDQHPAYSIVATTLDQMAYQYAQMEQALELLCQPLVPIAMPHALVGDAQYRLIPAAAV